MSGSFRLRLTVAFILIAGLASAALGIGTYIAVRLIQFEDFAERARNQGASSLALLPAETAGRDIPGLLTTFEEPEGLEFLVVEGQTARASRGLGPLAEVPEAVRQAVRDGETGFGETTVNGEDYLVVGGRAGGSGAETYLFFSLEPALRNLRVLQQVLGIGWVVVVCLSALAGNRVAQRTLRPVDQTAGAATAIARGRLDTRLPVRGHDEFSAMASSFNNMADALEAQLRALEEAGQRERRFAGDVAHELRTPLGSLVTAASLIEEELSALPPPARRPAELLITEARRLRNLVDELLELFRLDANRPDLRLETLSLRSSVAAVLARYRWEQRVELLGDEEVQVLADPRHLERVVANLVHNAVTHGGVGVCVRIYGDGEDAVLEVRDEGAGIAPDDLPHVFERFYKADRSRALGGSGLGLAIAAQNAELIGGRLTVESGEGRGATFRLRLPGDRGVDATGQQGLLPNGYDDRRSP